MTLPDFLKLGDTVLAWTPQTAAYGRGFGPGVRGGSRSLAAVAAEEDLLLDGFTTPARDRAPWIDPGRPSSRLFGGLVVHQVTGLDQTGRRDVTVLADGTTRVGPYLPEGKQVTVRGTLVGKNEAAVAYGAEWLHGIVSGQGCAGSDPRQDLVLWTGLPETVELCDDEAAALLCYDVSGASFPISQFDALNWNYDGDEMFPPCDFTQTMVSYNLPVWPTDPTTTTVTRDDPDVGEVGVGHGGGGTVCATHQVTDGETLYGIATLFPGVEWVDIWLANGDIIGDTPNSIDGSMLLKIPGPGCEPDAAADRATVAACDTWVADPGLIGAGSDIVGTPGAAERDAYRLRWNGFDQPGVACFGFDWQAGDGEWSVAMWSEAADQWCKVVSVLGPSAGNGWRSEGLSVSMRGQDQNVHGNYQICFNVDDAQIGECWVYVYRVNNEDGAATAVDVDTFTMTYDRADRDAYGIIYGSDGGAVWTVNGYDVMQDFPCEATPSDDVAFSCRRWTTPQDLVLWMRANDPNGAIWQLHRTSTGDTVRAFVDSDCAGTYGAFLHGSTAGSGSFDLGQQINTPGQDCPVFASIDSMAQWMTARDPNGYLWYRDETNPDLICAVVAFDDAYTDFDGPPVLDSNGDVVSGGDPPAEDPKYGAIGNTGFTAVPTVASQPATVTQTVAEVRRVMKDVTLLGDIGKGQRISYNGDLLGVEVEFTLTAEQGWLFGPNETLLDATVTANTAQATGPMPDADVLCTEREHKTCKTPPAEYVEPSRVGCFEEPDPWGQTCWVLPVGHRTGPSSLVVTVTAPDGVENLRLVMFERRFDDPNAPGCDPGDGSLPPIDWDFWKCGDRLLAEWEISKIPALGNLVADSRTQLADLNLCTGKFPGEGAITGRGGAPLEFPRMSACTELCVIAYTDAAGPATFGLKIEAAPMFAVA